MFDRILLALDDSPTGEVATDFTTALAMRIGASVHVVHVNEELVGGRGLTLRTRAEATALVVGVVDQLVEAGIRAGGSVRVSSYRKVAHTIVAAADERYADAIVLGSRRNRRLDRLFSTRVRERTTRLTSLPVLTAPSPLKITTVDGTDPGDARFGHVLDSLLH